MKTLQVERNEAGVVTVTLERPDKKNAINQDMWEELLEVFSEVGDRDTDRVLVLTGAGGNFCSGADLGGESERERHQLARMHFFGQVGMALHQIPKPAIAKVRGVAVGAGLNLALGCDLVVAAEDARLSEIFAKRGLSLDLGGSWLLPRLVGLHRAKELALLADFVTGAEAAEMGLVNRALPEAELDAFVADWAARLADGPPLALSLSKQLLNGAYAGGLREALDAEGMAQAVNIASDDAREAFTAFFQKRPPRFEGR
ncbi:MAG: enoyl-CoA hydratase [Proteobacteria bacterium]|nr:enoyl-CoA hydratase [Pseudomonadota bacterium]